LGCGFGHESRSEHHDSAETRFDHLFCLGEGKNEVECILRRDWEHNAELDGQMDPETNAHYDKVNLGNKNWLLLAEAVEEDYPPWVDERHDVEVEVPRPLVPVEVVEAVAVDECSSVPYGLGDGREVSIPLAHCLYA